MFKYKSMTSLIFFFYLSLSLFAESNNKFGKKNYFLNKDAFKILVYQDLNPGWHPVFKSSFHKLYLEYFIFEPLLVLNKDKKWISRLSDKEVVFVSDSKVSRRNYILIKLSHHARWGDGKEISFEDVIFTKKVYKQAPRDTVAKKFYDLIENIEFNSKNKELKLIFRRGKISTSVLGSFFILPAHLEKPLYHLND